MATNTQAAQLHVDFQIDNVVVKKATFKGFTDGLNTAFDVVVKKFTEKLSTAIDSVGSQIENRLTGKTTKGKEGGCSCVDVCGIVDVRIVGVDWGSGNMFSGLNRFMRELKKAETLTPQDPKFSAAQTLIGQGRGIDALASRLGGLGSLSTVGKIAPPADASEIAIKSMSGLLGKFLPKISIALTALSAVTYVLNKILDNIQSGFEFYKTYQGQMGLQQDVASKMLNIKTTATRQYPMLNPDDVDKFWQTNSVGIVMLTESFGSMLGTLEGDKGAIQQVSSLNNAIMASSKIYGVAEDSIMSFSTLLLRRFMLAGNEVTEFSKKFAKSMSGLSSEQKGVVSDLIQDITREFSMVGGKNIQPVLDNMNNIQNIFKSVFGGDQSGNMLKMVSDMWRNPTGAGLLAPRSKELLGEKLRSGKIMSNEEIISFAQGFTQELNKNIKSLYGSLGNSGMENTKLYTEQLNKMLEKYGITQVQMDSILKATNDEANYRIEHEKKNEKFLANTYSEYVAGNVAKTKTDESLKALSLALSDPAMELSNMFDNFLKQFTYGMMPIMMRLAKWVNTALMGEDQVGYLKDQRKEWSEKSTDIEKNMYKRAYEQKGGESSLGITEDDFYRDRGGKYLTDADRKKIKEKSGEKLQLEYNLAKDAIWGGLEQFVDIKKVNLENLMGKDSLAELGAKTGKIKGIKQMGDAAISLGAGKFGSMIKDPKKTLSEGWATTIPLIAAQGATGVLSSLLLESWKGFAKTTTENLDAYVGATGGYVKNTMDLLTEMKKLQGILWDSMAKKNREKP